MLQLKKKSFISRHKNFLYAFGVFLLINILAILVLGTIKKVDEKFQAKDRQIHAEDYFRRLELRMESYVAAAKTLRDRTLSQSQLTQESFEEESRLIQNYFKGFQALNFINPSGELVWVTPLKGNEEALGQNLFENRWVKELLMSPKAKIEMFMSPPLELYQGGRGLVIYYPLTKNGVFKGWMNIVFRAHPLLRGILTSEERRTYPLVIRDVRSDSFVYSDLSSDELEGQILHFYDFNLFGRVWRLGLIDKKESALPSALIWSYAFIFMLSLVLAVVFKLYLDRWDEVKANLQDALSEATLLKVLGHDLRSPLTMGELLIEKIERLTKELPETKAPLQEIKKVFSIQSEMLESVRNLQLFKRRKKEIFLGPISLYDAFENVKEMYAAALEDKKLNLHSNLNDECDFKILAHKSYFENNVLSNLISNAIKYSPKGRNILVEAEDKGREVVLRLSDEGQGLSQEIIERFHRGQSLPSTKGTEGETGTGFGLLLVKNFVELLGGDVEVQNRNPQGSTFTLVFPKA